MANPFMAMFNNQQMMQQTQQFQSQPSFNVPDLTPIKNILNMYQNAQNPQMMLQNLVKQNPQFANVMNLIQGRNPKTVFYEMCQNRGINPNDILNQLK